MAEHSQFQAVTNYYEQFTFALSVSPYANVLRRFEQVNQLVFRSTVAWWQTKYTCWKAIILRSLAIMQYKKQKKCVHWENTESMKKTNKTGEYFVSTSRWFSRNIRYNKNNQTVLRLFSVGRSYLFLCFFFLASHSN